MNTILVVCMVIVTCAILAIAVFLVRALMQIYRTAKEAELLLKGVNQEVELIKQFTSGIFSLAGKFSSPWFKAGSWIFSMVTSAIKKKQAGG